MTIKAFPDTFVSTAYATVLNNGTNLDALYEAVETFLQILPCLVDAGAYVVWVAAPFGPMLMPAVASEVHQKDLDTLLKPFTEKLTELGLAYQYTSAEHPTFLTHYNSISASWNVSDFSIGGRLIPRSLVKEKSEQLLDAVRFISSRGFMSGVAYNVANAVFSPGEVAVTPYFRKSLMSIAIGTPINYTDWQATLAGLETITNV